ncbi:hypothetical protein MMC30_007715 [Trapelia coarctata]|nr:hypothetical protein [Trapelia coarctata]
MAGRVNPSPPQPLHRRHRNGVLVNPCIHCTQRVSNTDPAQHTAGPLRVGPDVNPFHGFETALDDSLNVKEHVQQHKMTFQRKETSGSVVVNQQTAHSEVRRGVDNMRNVNNGFPNDQRTQSWLSVLEPATSQRVDTHGHGGHLELPSITTYEDRASELSERADSEYSLLEAINQCLHQDALNAAAPLNHTQQGGNTQYHNSNINPAPEMTQPLYASMEPMKSVEDED